MWIIPVATVEIHLSKMDLKLVSNNKMHLVMLRASKTIHGKCSIFSYDMQETFMLMYPQCGYVLLW